MVISAEPSPSERHAAGELQKFEEQISGVTLPISTDPRPKSIWWAGAPGATGRCT